MIKIALSENDYFHAFQPCQSISEHREGTLGRHELFLSPIEQGQLLQHVSSLSLFSWPARGHSSTDQKFAGRTASHVETKNSFYLRSSPHSSLCHFCIAWNQYSHSRVFPKMTPPPCEMKYG